MPSEKQQAKTFNSMDDWLEDDDTEEFEAAAKAANQNFITAEPGTYETVLMDAIVDRTASGMVYAKFVCVITEGQQHAGEPQTLFHNLGNPKNLEFCMKNLKFFGFKPGEYRKKDIPGIMAKIKAAQPYVSLQVKAGKDGFPPNAYIQRVEGGDWDAVPADDEDNSDDDTATATAQAKKEQETPAAKKPVAATEDTELTSYSEGQKIRFKDGSKKRTGVISSVNDDNTLTVTIGGEEYPTDYDDVIEVLEDEEDE